MFLFVWMKVFDIKFYLIGEGMLTSEKTDINFKLHNCDKFASLYTAYKGIDSSFDFNFFNQDIKKSFLKMAFAFLKDTKGKFLFVVTVGNRSKGKEADRLIPSDQYEAVAFANLISQISADQRSLCRDCNLKFKSCLVIETLKNYRKKLAINS